MLISTSETCQMLIRNRAEESIWQAATSHRRNHPSFVGGKHNVPANIIYVALDLPDLFYPTHLAALHIIRSTICL